jgi:hypothetical protein
LHEGDESDAVTDLRDAEALPPALSSRAPGAAGGRKRCNNLNVRSNTVKANVSWVVNSASHVGRYRLAKSVIVSG